MIKLHEFLRRPPVKGDVGLEIELEAEAPLPMITAHWRTVPDNSLRGFSNEYISKTPFAIDTVERNLNYLFKKLEGIKLITSGRTSVHVHVNVDDMTFREALNSGIIAWLYEPFILDNVAEHRRSSSFCLPLDRADYIVELLRKDVSQNTFFGSFGADNAKYTAIAAHHLCDLGTYEFRSKEGCTDVKSILDWTLLCHRIARMGAEGTEEERNKRTPTSIMEAAARDPAKFLRYAGFNSSEANVMRLYERILLMYDRLFIDWDVYFNNLNKQYAKPAAPQPVDPDAYRARILEARQWVQR